MCIFVIQHQDIVINPDSPLWPSFFSFSLPPQQGYNSLFYTNCLLVFLRICLPYWFITTYVAFHVLDINKACLIKPAENPKGPSVVQWTLM